ncbi:hypothetical protein RSAG8_09423, partial [Rhizoctonia solani AG-8 WAC10335]
MRNRTWGRARSEHIDRSFSSTCNARWSTFHAIPPPFDHPVAFKPDRPRSRPGLGD